jgi:fibro-slime domain-containing protein
MNTASIKRFALIAAAGAALAPMVATASSSGSVDDDGRVFNGMYWVNLPEYSDNDHFSDYPSHVTLVGTARDFRERTAIGGHSDFQKRPGNGFGHYKMMVADELGDDGKPVFRSEGYKVREQSRDAQGNNIIGNKPYLERMQGDTNGRMQNGTGDAVTSEDSFNDWFRDVLGTNWTESFPVTLVRTPGTNQYVFDDRQTEYFQDRNGFFIMNDMGFGNSAGDNKNFHFTYELATNFIYEEDSGQVFTFTGDDDVWVYIDGKLVIDLGGVHGRTAQTINLDRLSWLEDGEEYELRFFFAERHRTQSNFRIETTMRLRPIDLPQPTSLYD